MEYLILLLILIVFDRILARFERILSKKTQKNNRP